MIHRARQACFRIGSIFISPYTTLIFAALFWSGNFIVGRALKGDIQPISLNFWRWLLALAILLPYSFHKLERYKVVILSEWKIIAALGLTGIAAFHTCVYTALTDTTAINALIILSTSPMVITFMSWLFFKENIDKLQIIGIFISLAGAIILVCRGHLSALLHFQFNSGDIWMLAAVPLWAIYSILLKKKPKKLPHVVLLTCSVIVGVTIMVPVYFFSLLMGQGVSLNGTNLLSILYISIFASILAFLFWNKGVASIGPAKAGMYIHLMPFFGALLSIWFLKEKMALFHIVGAILVFLGIALTNRPWKSSNSSSIN